MTFRKLGSSSLEIAPLVFGGNVFGWTVDEAASFRLMDAFVDAGFNAIDTADAYSKWFPGNEGGESETIIGKWFQRSGKRDQVVLATKVGLAMGHGAEGLSLSKAYIMEEVEASLRRLQTDYIDLYQSHFDDPATPLEETLGAYDQLVKQGKVRFIGASNYKGDRLEEALKVSAAQGYPAYCSLQPLYNLIEREQYETEEEPACVRHGMGVITYFSLASGFLTGKYRSTEDLTKSDRGGRVEKHLHARGHRILGALDEVSAETGATLSSISLAWLLSRPSVTAPIVSATSQPQLEQLFAATRLTLNSEQLNKLNTASELP